VPSDKLESLIKFADSATAVRILTEQKLRWSSPDRFGDPFELSAKSEFNFDVHSLLDSTIKLASSMIFAPEQPKGESPLINAVRRWREEDRFNSSEEAHGILRELLTKMVDYRQAQLHAAYIKWQEHVRQVRVCCFVASADNISAWEQFGDQHRGVAIRFAMGEAEPFNSAKAIVYQTERPQLTSLREQLGAILHNRKDTTADRFNDHFFIKGKHRQLEQEWRCVTRSTQDVPVTHMEPAEWYDDLSFPANQVTGVFFGIHTSDDTKSQILALIQEHYPQAKLFQAALGKIGYTIEIEKIKA
jgi:hypothetical protein